MIGHRNRVSSHKPKPKPKTDRLVDSAASSAVHRLLHQNRKTLHGISAPSAEADAQMELLENRRLLSYTLPSTIQQYETNITTVANTAKQIIQQVYGNVDIPLLTGDAVDAPADILGNDLNLVPDLQKVLNYNISGWTGLASGVGLPAGFTVAVPFTATPPSTGQSAYDLFELTYSQTVPTSGTFTTSGQTGFPYLDDGEIVGGLTVTPPSVTITLNIGVDVAPNNPAGGSPTLFIATGSANGGSGITVGNFTATGNIGGTIDIGQLGSVTVGGTASVSLTQGSLSFNDPRSDGLNKVYPSDFSGGNFGSFVTGSVKGSISINPSLKATLPFLPSGISWNPSFNGSFSNTTWSIGSINLNPPSVSSILSGLGQNFLSLGEQLLGGGGSSPILGPLSFLENPLPLLDKSIAQLTGLNSDLPQFPNFGALTGDTQNVLNDLYSWGFKVDDQPTAAAAQSQLPSMIQNLIEGNQVDLISWSISGNVPLANFNEMVPIFGINVADVVSAGLFATFGVNADLFYHLGFGLDTHGFYLNTGPLLGVTFGANAGIEGDVSVFGFNIASAGGDVGLSITPAVELTAPSWDKNGRVYASDLALFGSNPVTDFVDALGVDLKADFTGDLFAKVDLLFWSMSWNWSVDVPAIDIHKDPQWPATNPNQIGGGGPNTQAPWSTVTELGNPNPVAPNTNLSGGTLVFNDSQSVGNDIVQLVEGPNQSVTINWLGGAANSNNSGGSETFQNVGAFDFNGSQGADTLITSPGFNISINAVSNSTSSSGGSLLMGGTGSSTLVGGSGSDTLIGGAGNSVLQGGSGLSSKTVILANDGSDTISGGSGATEIITGGGNSLIYGGPGNDSITTGAGNDTIYGGSGDFVVNAGSGNNTIYGYSNGSHAVAAASSMPPIINAGGGYDTIYGGDVPTQINGGTGSDTIYGGSGCDTINGGAGGNNFIEGVPYSIATWAQQSAATTSGYTTITLASGSISNLFIGEPVAGNGIQPGTVVNQANGAIVTLSNRATATSFSTQLTFGGNQIFGGGPGDTLIGGTGNDTITSGPGNETLYGGAGPATLSSGLGDASINNLGTGITYSGGSPVSSGSNLLIGGSGTDVMIADSSGTNTLDAGSGNDTLYAGPSGDYLAAGTGVDALYGGPGNDSLQPSFSANGSSPDTLDGGAGLNTLVITPSTANALPNQGSLVTSLTNQSNGTTITLSNTSGGIAISTGQLIQIDNEQMIVTAVNGNTLTVNRAQNGSSAAYHFAAANPEMLLNAIGPTDTTITVANPQGITSLPSLIQIDNEQMLVTGDSPISISGTLLAGSDANITGGSLVVSGTNGLATIVGNNNYVPGQTVTVTNTGTVFDGTYLITSANSSSFSYTITNYNTSDGNIPSEISGLAITNSVISGVSNYSALGVGDQITGTGLQANTTISSINGTTIGLSLQASSSNAPVSATVTGQLTVQRGWNGATNQSSHAANTPIAPTLAPPVQVLSTPSYYIAFTQTAANQFQATLSTLNGSSPGTTVLGQMNILVPSDVQEMAIQGGMGNNVIKVDPSVTRSMFLYGGPGNNTLYGGSGNDTLVAGTGTSVLYGGSNNSVLYGGDLPSQDAQPILASNQNVNPQTPTEGNDTLIAGGGSDELYAGAGNDVLIGDNASLNSNGYFVLGKTSGSVTLVGGSGNDLMIAGPGSPSTVMFGGTGNDVMAGDNAGRDVLEGSSGLSVTANASGNTITVSTASLTSPIFAGDAVSGLGLQLGDTVAATPTSSNGVTTITLTTPVSQSETNTVFTFDGNDLILGDNLTNDIIGGVGNDTLVGGTGVDYIQAGTSGLGDGNQTLYGAGDNAGWQTAISNASSAHVILTLPPNPYNVYVGASFSKGSYTVSGFISTSAMYVGEPIYTSNDADIPSVGKNNQPVTITAILSNTSVTISQPAVGNSPAGGDTVKLGNPLQEFEELQNQDDALAAEIEVLYSISNPTPAEQSQLIELLNEKSFVAQEQIGIDALLGATQAVDTLIGNSGDDSFYAGPGVTSMGSAQGIQSNTYGSYTFYNYQPGDTITGGNGGGNILDLQETGAVNLNASTGTVQVVLNGGANTAANQNGMGNPAGQTFSIANLNNIQTLEVQTNDTGGAITYLVSVTSGSNLIVGLPLNSNLYIGESVSGPDIPQGTSITGFPVSGEATLSQNATATLASAPLNFVSTNNSDSGATYLVSTNASSNIITNLPLNGVFYVGQAVIGPGIPVDTYITGFPSAGEATLSQAATATSLVAGLTFAADTVTVAGPALNGYKLKVQAGTGNDFISATQFITGETLVGGSGNDTIQMGDDNATDTSINGGTGTSELDIIGQGNDTIQISNGQLTTTGGIAINYQSGANVSSGNLIVTQVNTGSLLPKQTVSGFGIPSGDIIQSILSPSSFELKYAANASSPSTGETLTFGLGFSRVEVVGGSGANTFTTDGSIGNVVLIGGNGTETTNTFNFSGGTVTLIGGTGINTYNLQGAGNYTVIGNIANTSSNSLNISWTDAASDSITLSQSGGVSSPIAFSGSINGVNNLNGTATNITALTVTGGSGTNTLNASNMQLCVTLDGGIGKSTLIGGAGNDTFLVDSPTADQGSYNGGGGTNNLIVFNAATVTSLPKAITNIESYRTSAGTTLQVSSAAITSPIVTLSNFIEYPDGTNPDGDLTLSSNGILYGTAYAGGTYEDGVIYSVPVGGGSPTVLATFDGSNGANPSGGLTLFNGVLYGTTTSGGAYGFGTVFSVPIGGVSPTLLASFDYTDGSSPTGDLVLSNGVLYGTASSGGDADGDGTVFSVPINGSGGVPSVLATFNSSSSGSDPNGDLVFTNGILYGTTALGGSAGNGTVFSIPVNAANGTVSILTSFNQSNYTGSNGASPLGGMAFLNGILYGTTNVGGADGDGTIFSLNISNNTFSVLASFNGSGGAEPFGTLFLSSNGILYGTTSAGGAYAAAGEYGDTGGTVFSVPTTGGSLTVLASFGAGDAGATLSGGFLFSGGVLYGTDTYFSYGTEVYPSIVYSLPTSGGSFRTLATFLSVGAGNPSGGLILSNGVLYGVAASGGAYGDGAVFDVPVAGGSPNLLASLNGADGSNPGGNLILSDGILYGAAFSGGTDDDGTIFSVPIDGGPLTVLAYFNGSNGANPNGSLILTNGILFGTTESGGAYQYEDTTGDGTVFSVPIGGGSPTLMASFDGTDGWEPNGGMLLSNGVLYGTTSFQGDYGNGVVFSIPVGGGSPTVLASPGAYGGLVTSNGFLYGVSRFLTLNGAVFSVPIGGGGYTILADFANAPGPNGDLTLSNGVLFGTTQPFTYVIAGGGSGGSGGSVFSLNISGGKPAILASFPQINGNEDGPNAALVVSNGVLYGTTQNGYGSTQDGDGTAWELPIAMHWPLPSASATVSSAVVTFSATFIDSNSSYTGGEPATISWGDGQNSIVNIQSSGSGYYTFTASHIYSQYGTYNISATIIDPTGSAVVASTNFTGGLNLSNGVLNSYNGGAAIQIDTGVSSYHVRESDLEVFALHAVSGTGSLEADGISADYAVGGQVSKFALGADNNIYVLQPSAGQLSKVFYTTPTVQNPDPYSLQATDLTTLQLLSDSQGTLYKLDTGGVLYSLTVASALANPTNPWVLGRSDVKSIALTPDGTALNVLETNGDFWRFDGTNWTLISEPTVIPAIAASVTAGQAYNISISMIAQDYDTADGKWDIPWEVTNYSGTLSFASSDPASVLPANSSSLTFTNQNPSVKVFSVTFKTETPPTTGESTLGTQTLTVDASFNDGETPLPVSGMATVTVNPSAVVGFTVVPVVTTATAGSAFGVTVTAVDAYGNPVNTYTGTVHFNTGDGNANVVLPGSYIFTTGAGGDNGSHVFPVTLITEGGESLTVTDSGGLTGTGKIAILPGAFNASTSTITAPAGVAPGGSASLVLVARDSYGNPLQTGGLAVLFEVTSGTGGYIAQEADPNNPGNYVAFIDNANGTYTGLFQANSNAAPGVLTVGALVNNQAVCSTVVTIATTSLSGQNNFYLKEDADQQHVDVWYNSTGAGAYSQQLLLGSTQSLTITTSSAIGSVVVDLSAGNFLPSGGVTLNGGGAGSLEVIGTSGPDTVNFTSSQFTFDGVALTYSGVTTVSFDPHGGDDALNVFSGTLTLAAPTTATGVVMRQLSSVNIGAGATLAIASPANHANRALLNISSLSIAGSYGNWTGTLDLGNNDLDVPSGNLQILTNQIAQGFNNGTWTGRGITSTAAANDSTHLTALGIMQNNQSGTALYTASNPFDRATPGAGDILIKYTYYGDTNLDGKVDGSDYSRIDNGYLTNGLGWFNGDFNYDGTEDGSDYTLIDNAFNTQGASLAATIAAQVAVPSAAVSSLPVAAPQTQLAQGQPAKKKQPAASVFADPTKPKTASSQDIPHAVPTTAAFSAARIVVPEGCVFADDPSWDSIKPLINGLFIQS